MSPSWSWAVAFCSTVVAALPVSASRAASEVGLARSADCVSSASASDFDGDGWDDLAVGVPGEDLGGTADAGVVDVLYGASSGVGSRGAQQWAGPGMGPAVADRHFGQTLAAGDFDDDGCGDLAIGIPGQSAVRVLHGSPRGLLAAGSDLLTWQGGGAAAVAAGDFDGDGTTDLAIGLATGLRVHRGSPTGLRPAGRTLLRSVLVPWAAAGDFDGDGQDDLAVDDAWESVIVLQGGAGGLTERGQQEWRQNNACGAGNPGGLGGGVLAVGDFNGDGRDDLAASDPSMCAHLATGFAFNVGGVAVRYGSARGLDPASTTRWTQDSPSVPDAMEEGDTFGAALAAGDVDGDGRADLAIGSPGESRAQRVAAGGVTVLRGTTLGLSGRGSRQWSQDTPGIADAAERVDRFGAALTVAGFGMSGAGDLAVAAPSEALGPRARDAGAVHVIYGSRAGLSAAGSQLFTQNSVGVPDVSETLDGFGSRLAR